MAQGDVLEVVTNTNDGFTSITATLAVETPSAGDLLVSAYFTGAAVANLASGFTEALELTDAGNNDEGRLSFKRCASGSDNTVTESCGSSDENGVALMLIEGPFESAPLDVTAETAAGVGDNTVSTNTTGTTAQADEVAIAMWNDRRGSGGPSDNWASYTNSFVEQSDLKMANKGLAVATKLLTATGTVECTATNATYTLTSMAGIATFKLTVGAAAATSAALLRPNRAPRVWGRRSI